MRIQPHFDFTLLVLPGAFPSSVSTTLDILATAARLCDRQRRPGPRWRVCSSSTAMVALANGMAVSAQSLPSDGTIDASTWIVPGLGLAEPEAVLSRIDEPDAKRASQAIAQHAKRGGVVAASCSSVFLLHQAGLLANRKVTVSWWLAAQLQGLDRACTVQADRMLIEDRGVVTAGAAMAHADLVLHLLARQFGAELADDTARVLLLDARDAQAPYRAPRLFGGSNELVARITDLVESALPNVPKVSEIASSLAMSERTLARQIRAACGRSVQDVIQGVRLSKARRLLESSRQNIDEIAAQVGYQDSTALRRLMLKHTGATPSQFRARR